MTNGAFDSHGQFADSAPAWDHPDGVGWQLWRRAHTTGLLTTQLERNVGRTRTRILRNPAPLAADIWRRWGMGRASVGYRFHSELPLFFAHFPFWQALTPHAPSSSTTPRLQRAVSEGRMGFSSPAISRFAQPSTSTELMRREWPVPRLGSTHPALAQPEHAAPHPGETLAVPLDLQRSGRLDVTDVSVTDMRDSESSQPRPHTAADRLSVSAPGEAQRFVQGNAPASESGEARQQRTQHMPFSRHRDMSVSRGPMLQRSITHDLPALVHRVTTPLSTVTREDGQRVSQARSQSSALAGTEVVAHRQAVTAGPRDPHAVSLSLVRPQPHEHAAGIVVPGPLSRTSLAAGARTEPIFRRETTRSNTGTILLWRQRGPQALSTPLPSATEGAPLLLPHAVTVSSGTSPMLIQQQSGARTPDNLELRTANALPTPTAQPHAHMAGMARPVLRYTPFVTVGSSMPLSRPVTGSLQAESVQVQRQVVSRATEPLGNSGAMVGDGQNFQRRPPALRSMAGSIGASTMGINTAWIRPQSGTISGFWGQPDNAQAGVSTATTSLPHPEGVVRRHAGIKTLWHADAISVSLGRVQLREPAVSVTPSTPMPLMQFRAVSVTRPVSRPAARGIGTPSTLRPQARTDQVGGTLDVGLGRNTKGTHGGLVPLVPMPRPLSGMPAVVHPTSRHVARRGGAETTLLQRHGAHQVSRRPGGNGLAGNTWQTSVVFPAQNAGILRQTIAPGEPAIQRGGDTPAPKPPHRLINPTTRVISPLLAIWRRLPIGPEASRQRNGTIGHQPLALQQMQRLGVTRHLHGITGELSSSGALPHLQAPDLGAGGARTIDHYAALGAQAPLWNHTAPLVHLQRFRPTAGRRQPASLGAMSGVSYDMPLIPPVAPESRGDSPAERISNSTVVQTTPQLPAPVAASAAPIDNGGAAATDTAEADASQAQSDIDELVEKAWQKFMHKLTIEQERRGLSQWL